MICGIDPGKTGAIALLYTQPAYLEVHDMPILGKEINGPALFKIFNEFRAEHVFIESINSFGMGRQSAFNFGKGLGVLLGVLASQNIPYTTISPTKWKKSFGLTRDKDASRAAATRLFPAYADLFERKKDDGRAEATLIALYGQQLLGGSTYERQKQV